MSNYSRKELIEILDFDWKWSPCGKYWYDEENVRLSLTPQDVWGLWKSAEEIIKQLLEGSKRAKFVIQEGKDMFEGSMGAPYTQKTQALLKAAIAAAEGE